MEKVKIGIDLGGTKILMISGEKEYRSTTGIAFSKKDLEQEILSFVQENNLQPHAIGIAVPGLVQNNEIVESDVLPNLNGWQPDTFCQGLPFSIKLFNDVQAALAEEYAEFDEDFTGGVIMVGTGIGASFITHGKLLTGANGWAGEFGYFPLLLDGKIKRLDELSGGSYMARQLNISSLEMYNLAMAEDEKVISTIKKGGYYLGVAIAGLINLLDPNYISIGGGTVGLPYYWEELLKGAKENTLPGIWTNGMIKKVKAGPKVVALGAMRLV